MEFERSDVTVGAFVLGCVAAALAAAAVVNYKHLAVSHASYLIRLPDIAGIEEGAPLLYRGYSAGVVEKITPEYEPDLRFVVRLAVRDTIRVKQGTRVNVRNKGFGGAKALELDIPEGQGLLLPEGVELPAARELDIMSKADQMMGELEKTAKDFQQKGTSGDIIRLVKRADADLVKLDLLLSQVNEVLAEDRAPLKETLGHARGAASSGEEILTRKQAAIEQTLEHLKEASARLPAIAANMEAFSAEIRKHPWRLVRKSDAPEEKAPAK